MHTRKTESIQSLEMLMKPHNAQKSHMLFEIVFIDLIRHDHHP